MQTIPYKLTRYHDTLDCIDPKVTEMSIDDILHAVAEITRIPTHRTGPGIRGPPQKATDFSMVTSPVLSRHALT